MTQNPCSASPVDKARLNVRSSERTFPPANQPQVTHQLTRASRAHPDELRTHCTQPLRTPGGGRVAEIVSKLGFGMREAWK